MELLKALQTRITLQTVITLGDISLKESYGYGISKEKLEYEDLARIAKEKNLSLKEIKKEILKEI